VPTYEYECPKCACRLELRKSFSDTSPAKCPKCQKESRRVFSPVPIIFKGSGFYVTDHKDNPGHSASSINRDNAESGGDHEHAEPAKAKSDAPVATAKTVKDLANK
jgi:putative FmdB family regulatory protein